MSPPPVTVTSCVGSPLFWLVLLFVASRLLYLVLVDPSYLLTQPGDELFAGTIAQELVTGLTLPFTEYRVDNYSGGSLVIGALAAGFFLLFEPTLFALKLAPLLVFTLALVFWYWTIQRHVSKRVASYFAVLFCFSSPLFTAYSVATLGHHSESILLSALTVFLLFRMLADETGSPAVPVLLGLTAGFGLWFAYIYGLTLLAMLGVWFWRDKGMLRRPYFAWFTLGFLVGFAPWIIMNLQTHFAGLVIHGKRVWEHFGLAHLWESLAHPRKIAPYEFFADIASDDPRDLPRRAVNLLYSLLYLGPILTAGVLRLKTGRSTPAGPSPTRPTLAGFGLLYLVVFAVAVQLSDFRSARYFLPADPFLFFLTAYSLAYCQDRFPLVRQIIQTVFLASVVVLALGTHAPRLSLDRPGFALSAKGYSYASLPRYYTNFEAPAGSDERELLLEMVQRPFLSDILPKLSADDQRDLSRALVGMLAEAVPFNGRAEDIARIERLVPPGFDKHFYYQVGVAAMDRPPHELPKAVTAVEFVRSQSPAAHHLALVGIYRWWPKVASLDRTPDSLVNALAPLAAELSPHYWRALGQLAGRYWYETEQSLNILNARVQGFVPRLDPSVQRFFLQGVGEALFTYSNADNWVPQAKLERLPPAYQEGLFEGWGMALGEAEFFSPFPWKGLEIPYWMAWTKGLSERRLASIHQGKAQFEALFEGPDPSALKPSRSQ